MQTNNPWPDALRRHVVAGTSELRLRPQGLIPGQLLAFIASGVMIVLGLLGFAFTSGARIPSLGLAVVGLLFISIPATQSASWTVLERLPDGFRVSRGVFRWRTSSRVLSASDVATAMIAKDERGYRFEFPVYEHVRIAFESTPFNQGRPSCEIAELYRLPRAELESLRDTLAGSRALKDLDPSQT